MNKIKKFECSYEAAKPKAKDWKRKIKQFEKENTS